MLILLVDDDPDQLAVREMLVKQTGFDTIAASSADEALEAARANMPDRALIDLRLPDEASGRRLIRALKELHPEIRIALLSGHDPRRLELLPERDFIDEICQKGAGSLPALLKKWRTSQISH